MIEKTNLESKMLLGFEIAIDGDSGGKFVLMRCFFFFFFFLFGVFRAEKAEAGGEHVRIRGRSRDVGDVEED